MSDRLAKALHAQVDGIQGHPEGLLFLKDRPKAGKGKSIALAKRLNISNVSSSKYWTDTFESGLTMQQVLKEICVLEENFLGMVNGYGWSKARLYLEKLHIYGRADNSLLSRYFWGVTYSICRLTNI